MVTGTYANFCDCLVKEGLLSEQTAREVLQASAASSPAIGKLLLDHGLLDLRQLMHVVSLQADAPQRRFGELAVDLGYVKQHDLLEILRVQAVLRRHPAELLLERDPPGQAALLRALILYVKHLESRDLAR